MIIQIKKNFNLNSFMIKTAIIFIIVNSLIAITFPVYAQQTEWKLSQVMQRQGSQWETVVGQESFSSRNQKVKVLDALPALLDSDIESSLPGADESLFLTGLSKQARIKRAVILFQPGLKSYIKDANQGKIEALVKRFESEGYTVYEGTVSDKVVTKVITNGHYSKLIYCGHGGEYKDETKTSKVSTIAGRSAKSWKAHIRMILQMHYSKPELRMTPEQAYQRSVRESENFGFEEVVNMSCYSLSDKSCAHLFCKPGGIYWGVPTRYTAADGLASIVNWFADARNKLEKYVTPKKEQNVGLKDIIVNKEEIQISVWDHGCEDGDKITLRINDVDICTSLLLTKKKKIFSHTLTGVENTLKVIAVDSGTDCPEKPKPQTWNSAAIEIKGATKNGRQFWKLREGDDSEVRLVLQP